MIKEFEKSSSRLDEFDNFMFFNKNLSTLAKVPEEIKIWHQKANRIQACFDFTIPNYILDEIIELENSSCKDNLYYLINCAVLNNRITLENAKKIREIY